jgi:hypothetical protein
LKIVDRAIQVYGAAGVTQFTPLAEMYAHLRTLRIADGPDEVHMMAIARREIMKCDPEFRMLRAPAASAAESVVPTGDAPGASPSTG